MARIEWRNEYSVGIASIDIQHRQLVELIGEIQDAVAAGNTSDIVMKYFDALVEYAAIHFATEEDLFTEHAYPDRIAHAAEHDLFVLKLNSFMVKLVAGRESVCEEMLAYLLLWFTSHILTTDQAYAPFLREHGVE